MKTGLCCALLLAAAALTAQAQTERERIAADRAAATARFAERERTCRAQFVVTACVEAAQREEHATLTKLRRQEQALNDAERREAAARRRASLAEQAEAQAKRDGEAASAAPRDTSRRTMAAPSAGAATSRVHPPSAPAESAVDEQRNQASFDAKQRAAQAHREAVERRNAERAAQGKVAAPLPVPKGASAP